ncbi:MAG: N-acetyl-gamma-glutamyl-phosphate reductase [Cyanobacteria bacterium J06632_22]
MSPSALSVGVIGVYPHSTRHLAQLLIDHPGVDLIYLAAPRAVCRTPLFAAIPSHPLKDAEEQDVAALSERPSSDVLFLDLPSGLAARWVPQLLSQHRIIDLSADYRFSNLSVYQASYQIERQDHPTAIETVYGLPEWFGNLLGQARLVGCPSSVATAGLLALVPLLKRGLVDPDRIILDIKRGDDRAGCTHRLAPTLEIETIAGELIGSEVRIQVRSHTVPEPYGLLATVYTDLRDPGLVSEDLTTIYRATYRRASWLQVMPHSEPISPLALSGTNHCQLSVEVDTHTQRAVASVALDPYLKGKAGQAIQCLNLMQGWPETTGLPRCSYR